MDARSERIAKWFDFPMVIAAALVVPTILIEEAGPGEPLETVAMVLRVEEVEQIEAEVEAVEGDLLAEFRELSTRMGDLERALERRLRADP